MNSITKSEINVPRCWEMSKTKSKEELLAEEEYERALKKRAAVRATFKANAPDPIGTWRRFVKRHRSF